MTMLLIAEAVRYCGCWRPCKRFARTLEQKKRNGGLSRLSPIRLRVMMNDLFESEFLGRFTWLLRSNTFLSVACFWVTAAELHT
jgi:hypothetical protein